MTKGGVAPFQFKKHTPPKQVYQKYKIWNIDTGTIKARVYKKKDGAQSSIDKAYTTKRD
jgi:hypothetical protein